MDDSLSSPSGPIPISIRLDPDLLRHLRRIARERAFLTQATVTVADLIRESLTDFVRTKGDNSGTEKANKSKLGSGRGSGD